MPDELCTGKRSLPLDSELIISSGPSPFDVRALMRAMMVLERGFYARDHKYAHSSYSELNNIYQPKGVEI